MGKRLTMANGNVVDAEPDIKLRCSKCHGGNDEAPGGALTDYHRKPSDSKNVVRCSECGKKHSRDSLVDRNTPMGADV